ncbi:MAG: hypothetical protein AAF989_07865, partial [Planctomycetota bacterium]
MSIDPTDLGGSPRLNEAAPPKSTNPSFIVSRRRIRQDKLAEFLLWSAAALVFGVLAWMLVDVFWRGLSQINLDFLTSMPKDSGRDGGIASVIVSTV